LSYYSQSSPDFLRPSRSVGLKYSEAGHNDRGPVAAERRRARVSSGMPVPVEQRLPWVVAGNGDERVPGPITGHLGAVGPGSTAAGVEDVGRSVTGPHRPCAVGAGSRRIGRRRAKIPAGVSGVRRGREVAPGSASIRRGRVKVAPGSAGVWGSREVAPGSEGIRRSRVEGRPRPTSCPAPEVPDPRPGGLRAPVRTGPPCGAGAREHCAA